MTGVGTLPLHAQTKELRLDGFSITVVEGQSIGASLRANTSEIAVGTFQGNDLVIVDPTVSRHHFGITATPEGFFLRDLGSANGTWVGSVRVVSAYIESGTLVRAGRTILRVDQVDEDIREVLSPENHFGTLLGSSASMRRIFAALPRIASTESTVLLDGETGTGKGVLAAAIHEASPRASGPFVVLDCTAIAPSLVESELFGHVKGSFTGANTDRAGAFEQAKGGTIFIDEIGELPLDMQPKLLRALEERTVKRLGGNQRIKLDVRVIAATNRDLRAEVNKGTFRADLFYRLNVVRVHVPPLRERGDDIEQLARHFYADLEPDKPMPMDLVVWLRRQSWPGNVRELRAAVERAVILNDQELLMLDRQAPMTSTTTDKGEFDPAVPFRVAKQSQASQWEKAWLESLVAHAKGNISVASRVAKMDRSHLHSLLRKYEIGATEEAS